MFTKTDIEKYFIAEKSGSLFLIIIGIAAIGLAIVLFFFVKASWHKGAALPLILLGILQLTVGYVVYNRSDKDRLQNVYAYDMNPTQLKAKEIPRMEKVNKNFSILLYTEAILFIAAVVVFFFLKNDGTKSFWVGFCLALAFEALICLAFDTLAHSRAKRYLEGVKSFSIK